MVQARTEVRSSASNLETKGQFETELAFFPLFRQSKPSYGVKFRARPVDEASAEGQEENSGNAENDPNHSRQCWRFPASSKNDLALQFVFDMDFGLSCGSGLPGTTEKTGGGAQL